MTSVVIRRFLPLLLVAGLLSACSSDGPAKVRLGAVGRADVAEVVEAPATVSARATATLRSTAEGTIRRLYVADGVRVREGDVLAVVDSPTAREQLQQAQDADRQAAGGGGAPPGVDLSAFRRQADRTAKEGFAAARKAAESIDDPKQRAQVIAQIAKAQGQYATASAAAQTAVARLNAGLGSVSSAMASIAAAQRVQTKAAVRAAERTVQGLKITAPFDGVASLGGPAGGGGGLSGLLSQLPPQLQAQASGVAGAASSAGGASKDGAAVATGAPISSGDAVVTVTDVSALSLSADVDETDVLMVKRGTPASVQLDAVPGASYNAAVTGVGVTPKEASGGGVTYKVTLSLERGTGSDGQPAPWPKPGMSAVVSLRVREVRSTLSVPSSAIVSSGRESTVWVVLAGRAQRRVVRLGAQGDAMVQVLAGVGEGDHVIVRGADSVHDGQKVP